MVLPGVEPHKNLQNRSMQLTVIDPTQVRDISPLIVGPDGYPLVVPSATLEQTTPLERTLFCVQNGCYLLPTQELVAHVQGLIGNRRAIEIGAGNGVLSKALGIPATDSRQQERPDIAAYYRLLQQPTIRYGANVQKLDALAAVRSLKPQVVLAAWVTHRYDPRRHWAEGNEDGVDEEAVLAHCEHYVFIGNDSVHSKKSIWSRPHVKAYLPFVFSRAREAGRDFVAVWEGDLRKGLPE